MASQVPLRIVRNRQADALTAGVFFLFALIYLVFMHLAPFPIDYFIKSVPVAALALMTGMQLRGSTGIWLTLGLIFSVGGDVTLAMVPRGMPDMFLVGLGCFFAAHLCYILAFTRSMTWVPGRGLLMGGVVFFSVVMIFLLNPHLPADLKIPVFAYIGVITLMGITAALRDGVHVALIAGALLFMISDSCIAVNKFIYPFPQAGAVIMLTYYAAQYLIVRAFLHPRQD